MEQGFSENEKCFCFSIISNKIFKTNINRLGTENNYYDEKVEKELLARDIEHKFSVFFHQFLESREEDYLKIININSDVIVRFFRFMYFKSKKVYESVKNESKVLKMIDNFTHSDFYYWKID